MLCLYSNIRKYEIQFLTVLNQHKRCPKTPFSFGISGHLLSDPTELGLASYDEDQAAWILEKGAYGIWVGNSLDSARLIGSLKLDEDACMVQCEHICEKKQELEEMIPDISKMKEKEAAWLAMTDGQAKLRHSRKGLLSCMIAVVVAGIFVALILTAFIHKGNSVAMIGSFGLFDMILAGAGLSIGVKGFRERDKNYLSCKIGIGINGFILFCLILVFVRGLI